MSHRFTRLSTEQKSNAVQRVTALWAFTESGLGGIMHALKIPFTGLLVGGMAVIMISLIAEFSEHKYRQILKCAIIVLIVKALASPLTPFTAYIAISFQALLGFALFSLFRVNFISIILLSIIAMLESAIQKILVLIFFFGDSLWKATDKMVAFASGQLGHIVSNGSNWVIGIYLFIYIAGAFFIAWLAYNTINNFDAANPIFILQEPSSISTNFINSDIPVKKKGYKKIWFLLLIMVILSAILFFLSADKKQGWLEVLKTISWSISALLVWFVLISPLLTQGIQKLIKKKENKYGDEVLKALSFLPVLKKITAAAWQQSKAHRGFKRYHFFFKTLIYTTLTYTAPVSIEQTALNNPV